MNDFRRELTKCPTCGNPARYILCDPEEPPVFIECGKCQKMWGSNDGIRFRLIGNIEYD